MPASRASLARDITRCHLLGARALVLCLEDSVPDAELPAAEENFVRTLRTLHQDPPAQLPHLFLRPRTAPQLSDLIDRLGPAAGLLTGVAIPKYLPGRLESYLFELEKVELASGRPAYLLPILEASELSAPGDRVRMLEHIRDGLLQVRENVLIVRIGATDLSSAYGLRRPVTSTVYQIGPVAHAISDIVETFNPAGFPVSGPVWEHWGTEQALAGLAEETHLDLLNGLLGKTLIHPVQVPVVNAIHAVTEEDYDDAVQIAASDGGGVLASKTGTHMNEARPHAAWASRTLLRAQSFGVLHADVTWRDLLGGGLR